MQYPLQLTFKVLALAPQIYVKDAQGAPVMYVRQKLMKLKEDITVFSSDDMQTPVFRIKANKVLDFSATYAFTTPDGTPLGAIKRQGMHSLWRARYDLLDPAGNADMILAEENPWVKVLEGLVAEIPVVGFVVNYVLNPSYLVAYGDGRAALRLIKRPSLVGRRFEIQRLDDLLDRDEERAVLGVLLMTLMERERG
jgi:hypothetical protein